MLGEERTTRHASWGGSFKGRADHCWTNQGSRNLPSCAPDHFRKSELPLLCSYCTAVNLSRWYAHEVNEGDGNYRRHWLDATKLVALLASRLRLAPSTRLDKGKVEREVVGDAPRPWE